MVLKPGKIMRHFKGNLYLIIALAEHTETGEELVVYKALYGEGKIWVRPVRMFTSKVPEGKYNPTGQKQRFENFVPKDVSKYEMGD